MCHPLPTPSSWHPFTHGFVMVRHGSPVCVMVRPLRAPPGFAHPPHTPPWFTVPSVTPHGAPLHTPLMVHMVPLMVRMVRHGSLSPLSWFVMVHCHGSSWFTVMVVMVRLVRDVHSPLRRRSCDPLFSQSGSPLSNLIFDETSYFPLSSKAHPSLSSAPDSPLCTPQSTLAKKPLHASHIYTPQNKSAAPSDYTFPSAHPSDCTPPILERHVCNPSVHINFFNNKKP